MKPKEIAYLIGALVLIVAGSYGFALAGEPQSFWLWHDVLGLLR